MVEKVPAAVALCDVVREGQRCPPNLGGQPELLELRQPTAHAVHGFAEGTRRFVSLQILKCLKWFWLRFHTVSSINHFNLFDPINSINLANSINSMNSFNFR